MQWHHIVHLQYVHILYVRIPTGCCTVLSLITLYSCTVEAGPVTVFSLYSVEYNGTEKVL